MPSPPQPTVWPVPHHDDTAGALRFPVDAFGLRAAIAVDDDDGDPIHAELRSAGGAIVSGFTKHTGEMRAGPSAVYVVARRRRCRLSASRRRERRDRPTTAPNSARFRGPDTRVHRPRPGVQPLDLRHLPRRAPTSRSRDTVSVSSVLVRCEPRDGRLADARVGRAASALSRTTSTTRNRLRERECAAALAVLPPIVRAGRPLRSRGYARLSREARATAPHTGSPGRRS
jgi:hypothetical protein